MTAVYMLRDDLRNSQIRFEREGFGRVGFLGGSITEMDGWRNHISDFLQARFPNTEFTWINAGIPSTDTTLGATRMERDLFRHGQIDLLFVEFAVNDETNRRTPVEMRRGLEGIIRKALAHNRLLDIVLMYFVDEFKIAAIERGITPEVIQVHEQIADHNGVTSVNLALEVTRRMQQGEFDWTTFGGVHPAPFGHTIYSRTIWEVLCQTYHVALTPTDTLRPHRLPSSMVDSYSYVTSRFIDFTGAEMVSGWRIVERWRPTCGATRPGFVDVPMLCADTPGATLRLTFTGTMIGILVVAGLDVGMLTFCIDGQTTACVDQFTEWSENLHIPWVYTLKSGLPQGQHTLELTIAAQRNVRSAGYAARIVSFIVNE